LHGLDLARRIRTSSWNKSTPIVVVTGRDDKEAMQEAFSLGATFFLHKPVDRQRLSKLLRTVKGGLVQNRRRYSRVPFHTEVFCTKDAHTFRGPSLNLSHGGIQIETTNLKQGDFLQLSFQLPSPGPKIEAIGTVVWSDGSRQGIQFSKMTSQHEQAVRDFIDQSIE
jgi:CheY-like chemotaxis protein